MVVHKMLEDPLECRKKNGLHFFLSVNSYLATFIILLFHAFIIKFYCYIHGLMASAWQKIPIFLHLKRPILFILISLWVLHFFKMAKFKCMYN